MLSKQVPKEGLISAQFEGCKIRSVDSVDVYI